jgi:membrane-bound lytic murein transglycosylase D
MKKIIFLLLLCVCISKAQVVDVPNEISFAGINLKLTNGAQKLIQADVEAIMKNQKYFAMKVERANLFFPVIEKVFEQENFPSDFKFLALQESDLVSDVVSTSNAVGYWQFKKETAQEVGLRVDREVDERMNIISSTRGAARYLKKNNYFLNNWVYTLLAYNLGRGGVASYVEERYNGAIEMELDKHTHWYVIRFLAHKLAYEQVAGKNPHPELVLQEHSFAKGRTLGEISEEMNISFETLQFYNKWLFRSRVPEDKVYPVILPVKIAQSESVMASLAASATATNMESGMLAIEDKLDSETGPKPNRVGIKNANTSITRVPATAPVITLHNRLKAVVARPGDDLMGLVAYTGIDADKFLLRNDLKKTDKIIPGQYYYLEAKRSMALISFYEVQKGETLWDISQKYGIRVNNIKRKNRIRSGEALQPGRVLWLRKKRPGNVPIEIRELKPNKSNGPELKRDLGQETITPIIARKEIASDSTINKVTDDVIIYKKNSNLYKYHLVESGQTLYAISRLYNVKTDSLCLWNNINARELKVGSRIIVCKNLHESNADFSGKKIFYIVKKGDTIYNISKEFRVSVDDLRHWNNKTSYNVSIGEQIIIMK